MQIKNLNYLNSKPFPERIIQEQT